MSLRGMSIGATAVLLGLSLWEPHARPESLPSATVASVRSIPLVRVRLVVRNTTSSPIVVPKCGERAGTPMLCGLATHLEVMTEHGWKQAEPAKERGVLGGLPITVGVSVMPDYEKTFEWEFASNLFTIGRGAQVRLLLDTWRDEPSMKTEKPALLIPTGGFEIPVSGL